MLPRHPISPRGLDFLVVIKRILASGNEIGDWFVNFCITVFYSQAMGSTDTQ